jgi:hypothetical protein
MKVSSPARARAKGFAPDDAVRLADGLAGELEAAPDGLTCDELARRVRRRRADVLAVLRADPFFRHRGRTRGSRWHISPQDPPEALGRNETAAAVSLDYVVEETLPRDD